MLKLTTMHATDAGSDLHFMVEKLAYEEWARSIPAYSQLPHQLDLFA